MGMKPGDLLIAFVPSELFPRIAAGVSLDAADRFGEGPSPVEIIEEFFVSYRIQGICIPIWEH